MEKGILKFIREKMGLTQQEFAQRLDCSISALQHWEKGMPMPEDKEALAYELAEKSDVDFRHAPEYKLTEPAVEQGSPQRTMGEWREMLDGILTSDYPEAIVAVQTNLELFHRYIEAMRKMSRKR